MFFGTVAFGQSAFSSVGVGDPVITATSLPLTTALGTATAQLVTPVDVTTAGQLGLSVGTVELLNVAEATGVAASMSLGTVDAVAVYAVTGLSQAMSIGSLTITGTAVISPTGIDGTLSVGSPNSIIWNDVSKGTSQTWTEVEVAA
tara:strand:+ start:68 stop:505 length:438 start_codon:yes stop_codon:yes gene_type:complete